MGDTYQAIYDAVRSRISNGNVGDAVSEAIRSVNVGHYVDMAMETIRMTAAEYERPSVLYRPSISIDGTHWCALYGDNLQDGVAGFGLSPDEAMQAFDKAWLEKLGAKK